MKDKNLMSVLKVLPKLALREETRGLRKSVIRQWGVRNAIRIVARTIGRVGLRNYITSLLKFRLDKSTPYLLISMWEIFGDREAVISGERRITYSELKERVFRLSNGLKSLGLQPKDKFAELLYNGNEFFEAFLAG
ncbi:MAG: AMP-binding protein, partial [Deltaproteobacteria bacterium]|nr:AMP-binding protein [Deltaproteobacteria bacterium]